MQHKSLVFLDGGTLFNILASGHAVAICTDGPFRFAVPKGLYDHPMLLWTPPDNQADQRDSGSQVAPELAVDTQELIAAGMLEIFDAFDTEECVELFVNLAVHLSDAQAKTTALALLHSRQIASDDRKLRCIARELDIDVRVRSTLELIHEWEKASHCPATTVSAAVRGIAMHAQFCPSDDDQLIAWWREHL